MKKTMMQPRLRCCFITIVVALILARNSAVSELNEQNRKQMGSTMYNSFGDDIYLDDQDGLEGSGRGGGDIRDDLEASGSGLGPDDEDGDDGGDFINRNTVKSIINKSAEPKTIDDAIYKTIETDIHTINRPKSGMEISSGGAEDHDDESDNTREVYIMNPKHEDRASSFFTQPGVLAAVIGGAVVGLLCAILVVMFIVYRMRKKDEGSYALDEPRRVPASNAYPKSGVSHQNREFYA